MACHTLQSLNGRCIQRLNWLLLCRWWCYHAWQRQGRSHGSCHQFLQRCWTRQISLNKDKCNFAKLFLAMINRLLHTPHNHGCHVPISNTGDLWSFFGLVKQLTFCTDTVSKLLLPMRSLLSTKQNFLWSAEHEQAFSEAKAKLTEVPTLAYFSLGKRTGLCTYTSRQGLGFVLQRLSNTDQWSLVQAGSCFLTLAESQYAVIE